jgi:hypothetical protein
MTKKIMQLKVVCSCVAMNEVTILSSLSVSFLLVQIGIMLCSYRKQRKKFTLLSVPFPLLQMPFPLLHIFIITLCKTCCAGKRLLSQMKLEYTMTFN